MDASSQPDVVSNPWGKAIGQATGAVYAPFVAVALFTLLAVPCPHCKQTVWVILPVAPGLFAGGWGLRQISHALPSAAPWIVSCVLSVLAVAGVAFALPKARRLKWPVIIGTLVIATALAVLNLMLIRA